MKAVSAVQDFPPLPQSVLLLEFQAPYQDLLEQYKVLPDIRTLHTESDTMNSLIQ
jgi:hypothetical protein